MFHVIHFIVGLLNNEILNRFVFISKICNDIASFDYTRAAVPLVSVAISIEVEATQSNIMKCSLQTLLMVLLTCYIPGKEASCRFTREMASSHSADFAGRHLCGGGGRFRKEFDL